MSEEKPLVAGRYRLEQMIGRGGMGDVFRGTDTHTGQTIAAKLLHEAIVESNPDIVDRFKREGEALRRLNHPNIVSLLDAVEESGKHYLVMEYVGGGSLRDLIDEQSRLPLEAVLNIALDLADALTRAHRLNIIHRDIKPDNVMLAEDGTPRLTDFGVAHMADRTRLTQTGAVIGTYAYLSPEACNGLDLDERADIWSFGVMLFEMLAGRVPFQEPGTAAILTAILTKPAPDIMRLRPGLPEPLADLIARMLEKDRERRVSSVRVVGAELEALIRGLDTPLRDMVHLTTGQEPGVGSRFSTPSDEVPAMARSEGPHTHGLSLYPAPGQPSLPPGSFAPSMMTPGGTPLATAEMAPAAAIKWKWIALMVIVTVVACSIVAVIAILLGPERDEPEREAPGGAVEAGPNVSPLPGGPGEQPAVIVEPVEPGEYMVLVAQLESIDEAGSGEEVRFIVNDLRQALEETVPYSNIRVRTYPGVITSDAQALAAAEEVGATVVVWGNVSPDLIELEVQMGVTAEFPYIQFERDVLERTTNVRVHMTEPQRESIAPYVLNVLTLMQNADGNAFESLRIAAILSVIAATPAEIVGNTVAANVHRATLSGSPEEALADLTNALSLDAGNALLYITSGLIKQRMGQIDDAKRDALTAQRVGPPGWALPPMVLAAMTHDETVIDLFSQVIEQRPDDWFPYFFRGAVYYEVRDQIPGALELAQADLDTSIALKPEASFPYIYSALIALHEGRMADAGATVGLVLTEFPDPDYMRRLLLATFSEEVLSPYVLTLSAFTNLTLGQYGAVIESTTAGLELYPEHSDAYLMQGIAYCGLGDFAAAEASFSGGLEHDPSFVLLHLMRADARWQQANETGAQEDFSAIEDSPAEFAPLIQSVQDRELSCANFFSPDNPVFGTAASAQAALPAEAVAAVEPVEPDEYMVLVADIGPQEGVEARDVTRFVAEDLRRIFEEEIPVAGIRMRQYPAIITSNDEARAVAEATGADVIVWGSYTAEAAELEVQMGVTRAFRHIAFPRQTLERTANVRVRLTDERQESVALYVLNVLNVMANADGDEFRLVMMFMLADSLSTPGGEIVGDSVAAHVHRALNAYGSDSEFAIDEFTAAIDSDHLNALPYTYRGLAYLRAENEPDSMADAETMRQLGPDNWATPLYFTTETTTLGAIQTYTRLAELRPDDWFVYFMRGIFYYYQLYNLEQARADFEQSIALRPIANLPYVSLAMIALREGRMADAQALLVTVLTEYPDPEMTNRAMRAVYGGGGEYDFTGTFFAASTNYALGQYDDVVAQIQTFTDYIFSLPDSGELIDQSLIELSDIYLLEGLAHCNLKSYAAAEDAYDKAISYSKDYELLYVLRGQMRSRQGKRAAAEEDFAAAREADLGPEFAAWVESGARMDWTCETMQNYQPPG